MRVTVGNCVISVMGDKKDTVTSEKSRHLRMCPLTSSISISESHSSDVGSAYPRRILLSFLRQRLLGTQDKTNCHHRFPSYTVVNSKAMDNQISQVVASDDMNMAVVRCPGGCGCDHTETRSRGETSSGGMRNHCVSGPIFASSTMQTKSVSCTCLPLDKISNFTSPEAENRRNTSLLGDISKCNSLSNTCSKSLLSIEFKSLLSLENDTVSHRSNRGLVLNSVISSVSRCFNINGSNCRRRSSCIGGLFKVLLFVSVLLLISGSASACGPGRGAGRRRAPRKLTPLVYKQHVPNVPENTLSASGFTEGRITRKDQKFKNLVPNYNQDIIFRDEEGTGADRLMTQRCKEKLNTLAISVMNQWPGVKLRVNEGWDEDLHHATHSLHYEGRAVDITTSDKDRSKYGMLARLAVEAGFDWVYYESRAHIHCSVKSDSSQASRTGGCFDGNSTVETPEGAKKMADVQPGDKILTVDSNGKEVYSDVLMFLDRNTTEVREFFELTTESGAQLTLTPSHLLYSIRPEGVTPDDEWLLNKNQYLKPDEISKYFLNQAEVTFAKFVQIGDWVLVKHSQVNTISPGNLHTYAVEKVVSVEAKIQTGVYAPLTVTGNLVVDGVLSSCYALIADQAVAHVAFAPVRLVHNFRQSVAHLWKQFSRFISFSHNEKDAFTNDSLPHHQSSNRLDSELEADVARTMPLSSAKSSSSSYSNDNQGIHWYASFLYSATRYILPSSLIYE